MLTFHLLIASPFLILVGLGLSDVDKNQPEEEPQTIQSEILDEADLLEKEDDKYKVSNDL